MAKMRARRAPFTDARDGRLKSRVRRAFRLYDKPLTTTELVKHCYCWVLQGEKIKSWHRTNIARVADVVAIRIGRATSQGRPIMLMLAKYARDLNDCQYHSAKFALDPPLHCNSL